MTWQILEGDSSIPITLFDAVADLDAGPIRLQQEITLQGHELVDEWRPLQARATFDLCLTWFNRHPEVLEAAKPQYGEASHYPPPAGFLPVGFRAVFGGAVQFAEGGRQSALSGLLPMARPELHPESEIWMSGYGV